MENSKLHESGAKMSAWFTLLIATLVSAVSFVMPSMLLIVAPALWAYAGARTKPQYIALPALVYAAGAFANYSGVVAAGLTGAAVLSAVLVYALLTRRVSNAYTALTLAGVFLAGLYVAFCMPGILAGRGAFADMQAAVGEINAFYRSALAQMPQINADYATFFTDAMDTLYETTPTLVVAALGIFAGILGLSNLLFFRLFCRKHPEIAISPMRPFRDWTLPQSLTMGLFVLLIGSLILQWMGWTFAESFSNAADALVGMPLLLQGLCVIDFLIYRSQKNVNAGRTLTYIGIGVLYAYLQMPLIMVGIFDQIFHLRARLRGTPPRAAV